MKNLRFLLLVCPLSSVLCVQAATPERFERTKARIDALLDHRLKPGELPAKPANPFAFNGPNSLFIVAGPPSGPSTPVVPEPVVNAVMDDDQILAFCVGRLRIGGQVQRGERAHLLINAATYKEGDLIPVRANAETVYYVKLVRIAPGEVIFGYNATFVTLPLKT
jgi:hypothetical protein